MGASTLQLIPLMVLSGPARLQAELEPFACHKPATEQDQHELIWRVLALEAEQMESQTAQPIPANKKDILHIRHFADTLMRANKGSAMQITGRRKVAPRTGSTGRSQPSHWAVTSWRP